MPPFESYLTALREIRSSGEAVDETSYYGALESFLNDIGKSLKPRVRCVLSLKNRGAGMPDGGLFTEDQFKKSKRVACQVSPLNRLGARAQALDAPVESFQDAQENTNSILLDSRNNCTSQWKSGSIRSRNRGREANTRPEAGKRICTHAPPQARQDSLCPLDKDLSWKSANRTSCSQCCHSPWAPLRPLEHAAAARVKSLPVPARKKPDDEHQFKVGDCVSVTLHAGRLVDATIRAIVEWADGLHFQADYGKDETALVELWRVHPK